MEEKQRESFLFYRDWWESMKDNDAIRYEVYDAIMTKVFDDIEPEVSPMAKMALKFILPVIGRDHDKYNDVREKRKAAVAKRWEKYKKIQDEENNTKDTNEYKCIQVHTSATDNVNVNDNVNDNVNVNDNGSLINRDNKNNKKTPKGVKKEKEVAASAATPEDELKKRADKFYNVLVPYVETYGKEMIRQFYDYWTEPNKSRTKMRYELERTWDTKRRLNTWASRENINRRRTNYDTNSEQARQQREQDALNIMRRLAAEDDADEQVR